MTSERSGQACAAVFTCKTCAASHVWSLPIAVSGMIASAARSALGWERLIHIGQRRCIRGEDQRALGPGGFALLPLFANHHARFQLEVQFNRAARLLAFRRNVTTPACAFGLLSAAQWVATASAIVELPTTGNCLGASNALWLPVKNPIFPTAPPVIQRPSLVQGLHQNNPLTGLFCSRTKVLKSMN